MRVTYRSKSNRDYWAARWANVAIDSGEPDPGVYPLKYALMTTGGADGPILEAGCGAGRVLRYYKSRGRRIVGLDFIPAVVERLRQVDRDLTLAIGDVTSLGFGDRVFSHVLAFGLYHNLARGIDAALAETYRVLLPGGRLCASFRADNWHTRLIDRINGDAGTAGAGQNFHKVNLTKPEVRRLLEAAGFEVEQILAVQNMPVLYKFRAFRARAHKEFDEARGRTEGYRLSPAGRAIQRALSTLMPDQCCNVYVAIARR